MHLFLLSVLFLQTSFQAARALHCMQGVQYIQPNGTVVEDPLNKMHENVECSSSSVYVSDFILNTLNKNNDAVQSFNYMCFHMLFKDSIVNLTSILKGCIHREHNVCDEKFSKDDDIEKFCSHCDYDNCNSAQRLASHWKMLSLTLFTIVCLFQLYD